MNTENSPEETARRQVAAFYAARGQNPDLLPYMGPEDILNRFLAGEIVTAHDMLTDQSLWTVQPILPEQNRRLRWMLENLSGVC